MIGFTVGGGLWGATYQQVFPKVCKIADYGATVIPNLWGINHWLFIFAFTAFVLGLFTFFRVKEL
ncbi:MAG: hypothetical protein CO150_05375 [Nitrospirae bacterium CG_4_9_14_3_um_filter_53_35]|nr:MAG: hypothetical protein COT35_07705 [Nitrospirae bacterium CG08_land_8_20_14_0_20_52_24]PIV82804.1 MAG: hypothetical protein COW52_11560 [Nitrospirae bacterium CG17_big_fil_post_rev_8_21_14_2_50_50_9]PIW84975.1 MAG: hypothetical protein COZ95_07040 [Nitrospirae bacterium CG_4_8_14_3_um_filter_50_41]PJA75104.1 MAG: hypothetical protein CO150_05375 [Nitrospirae bacterium CG_4_9_14_3_um_filter_53_35]